MKTETKLTWVPAIAVQDRVFILEGVLFRLRQGKETTESFRKESKENFGYLRQRICTYANYQHEKYITYMTNTNPDLPPEPKMYSVTAVVVDEATDLKFDVTVVKEVSQDAETYIETIIEGKHPAFSYIKMRVSMLRMADAEEVPGVGLKFPNNVFVVMVDEDTYKAIRDVD